MRVTNVDLIFFQIVEIFYNVQQVLKGCESHFYEQRVWTITNIWWFIKIQTYCFSHITRNNNSLLDVLKWFQVSSLRTFKPCFLIVPKIASWIMSLSLFLLKGSINKLNQKEHHSFNGPCKTKLQKKSVINKGLEARWTADLFLNFTCVKNQENVLSKSLMRSWEKRKEEKITKKDKGEKEVIGYEGRKRRRFMIFKG